MAVIPLTLIISLCLVFTFVIFFLREQSVARRRFSSAESEALLPLADETPRTVGARSAPGDAHEHDGHAHDHDHSNDDGCGCRDGSRPPCPGCLHRRES
ncbi:hypothetical protein MASR2M8_10510 [Opitutaceae bacterium]